VSAEQPQRRRAARRVFARVEKGLAARLEPGEALESAVFGHRYVPGLMVLLFLGTIGDLIYMLVARPYYLALTDRRFFLLNASRWGWIPRPGEPVFGAEPGSVRIDEPRRFLVRASTTVQAMGQNELRLAIHRQYWRELDHMRSLLDQRAAG